MNNRIFQGFSCFLVIVLMTFGLTACKESQSLPPTSDPSLDTSITDSKTDLLSQSIFETERITDSDEKVNVSEQDKVTDSKENSTVSETVKETDTVSETDRPSVPSHSETDETANSAGSTPVSASASEISSTVSKPSDTVNSDTEPEDTPSESVNTDITPISPDNYYGIQWLSSQPNGENLVKTYRELASGIKERKESIPLSAGISEKELSTVWSCCLADYPQYFWVGSRYKYYRVDNKVTKIEPEYTVTEQELSNARAEFDRSVYDLLRGITTSMSQYEIEKTLHDRLILHCKYEESSHAHTAYGALVDGTAVCEGIAKAFQHLCRSVGIETLFVVGRSDNPNSGKSEGHAWNIVKIDGNYYHVDVTWDNVGEPEKDQIHYAWFNLSDSWLTKDHVLSQEGYSYPECTEIKENYYVKTNGIISELTVLTVTEKAVKQDGKFFFRGYLTSQTDPFAWMTENSDALAKEFGLNGYSYEIITVGSEVTIIMKKFS